MQRWIWAMTNRIVHAGWCPLGCRTEDGSIDTKYLLAETESPHYLERTKRNLIDSDGTLIVNRGALDGGSLRTLQLAARHGKPVLVVQSVAELDVITIARVRECVQENRIATLNVAGSRESKCPGIYDATHTVLDAVFPWKEVDNNAPYSS